MRQPKLRDKVWIQMDRSGSITAWTNNRSARRYLVEIIGIRKNTDGNSLLRVAIPETIAHPERLRITSSTYQLMFDSKFESLPFEKIKDCYYGGLYFNQSGGLEKIRGCSRCR